MKRSGVWFWVLSLSLGVGLGLGLVNSVNGRTALEPVSTTAVDSFKDRTVKEAYEKTVGLLDGVEAALETSYVKGDRSEIVANTELSRSIDMQRTLISYTSKVERYLAADKESLDIEIADGVRAETEKRTMKQLAEERGKVHRFLDIETGRVDQMFIFSSTSGFRYGFTLTWLGGVPIEAKSFGMDG